MANLKHKNNFGVEWGERAEEKIGYFLSASKEKMHLVLDFDRTLTLSRDSNGENVSTWEILKNHLPAKALAEYSDLYEKYRPVEAKGLMSTSDAVEWWGRTLDLFQANKLKWSDVVADVDKKMPIRDGAKALFDICYEKNIPVIIISAGIKDVIELWCQKFGMEPSIILSTSLHFDADGFVSGWEKNSLVHILNKREKSHKDVSNMKKERPNTILIGDSVDDCKMVDGQKNVLRILIDDPRPDIADNAVEILQKFDIVIKNGSLTPAVEVIREF